jgi:excisionase family DNA binding protein
MTDVRLLSYAQVAERLGVDRRTISRMIGLGQLPGVWVGRRKRVPEPAVNRFVEAALAANIGTQTALRVLALLAAEADRVTHERGDR